MSVTFADDSETLRSTFSDCKNSIQDGWSIISVFDPCYSYETDMTMFLRGPDGQFYQNHAACCSCYGIEDQWDPVVTNVDAVKAQIEQLKKMNVSGEELACYEKALEVMCTS